MDAYAETSTRIHNDHQRWAENVHTAVLRQLADPARQLTVVGGEVHVQVVRSWTDVHDGHPVLYLIYRHPWWRFTTGLLRHLDEIEEHPWNPPTPGVDLAVDLADNIVTYSIEEAPGVGGDVDGPRRGRRLVVGSPSPTCRRESAGTRSGNL